MTDPIRVGIVGASIDRGPNTNAHLPWARAAHAPAIKSIPEYKLHAVATTKQETADTAARFFEAPLAFGDARKMIEHPEVDLVVVSVRVPYHYDLVRHAIEAGKHVYCEWPLALTTELAEDLASRADRQGVRNMVGLQARAAPTFNYVKDLIADGYVGRVLSVNVNFAVPTWGGFVEAPVAYLNDKANNATILAIYGGHSLDVLGDVFGEFESLSAIVGRRYETVEIIETGKVVEKTAPDQVLINGVLENGTVLSYHLQGGVANLQGLSIQVRGTDGDLEVTSTGVIEAAPLVLRGVRGGRDTSTAVEYREIKPLELLPVPQRYRHVPESLGEGPPLNVGELYVRMAKAIREGHVDLPDFRLAARRQALLDSIEQASSTGQRVHLSEGVIAQPIAPVGA